MTTAPIANNPYGYQGHLSEAVLQLLENHWPWYGGMGADAHTLYRHRSTNPNSDYEANFDEMIRRIERGPIVLRPEDKAKSEDIRQLNLKTLQDAGYAVDGKVDGDKLWADFNTAGLISHEAESNFALLEPFGVWWHRNNLRPYHFDGDGYLIANSVKLGYEENEDLAKQRVAEALGKFAHERGNPRTPDEALLDASIGPKLPPAVDLGRPH